MVKYEPSCQLLVGGDTFPISCKWYLSRRIKQPSWNWKKGFVSAASALMLSELLWTTSCDQIRWKVPDSKRNHTSVAFRPKWSSEPHSIWVSKALCKPQQIFLTGRTYLYIIHHWWWLWTINWQMSCLNLWIFSLLILYLKVGCDKCDWELWSGEQRHCLARVWEGRGEGEGRPHLQRS